MAIELAPARPPLQAVEGPHQHLAIEAGDGGGRHRVIELDADGVVHDIPQPGEKSTADLERELSESIAAGRKLGAEGAAEIDEATQARRHDFGYAHGLLNSNGDAEAAQAFADQSTAELSRDRSEENQIYDKAFMEAEDYFDTHPEAVLGSDAPGVRGVASFKERVRELAHQAGERARNELRLSKMTDGEFRAAMDQTLADGEHLADFKWGDKSTSMSELAEQDQAAEAARAESKAREERLAAERAKAATGTGAGQGTPGRHRRDDQGQGGGAAGNGGGLPPRPRSRNGGRGEAGIQNSEASKEMSRRLESLYTKLVASRTGLHFRRSRVKLDGYTPEDMTAMGLEGLDGRKFSSDDIERVREVLVDLRGAMNADLRQQMRAQGLGEDEINTRLAGASMRWATHISRKIAHRREARAWESMEGRFGRTRERFVNWWARRGEANARAYLPKWLVAAVPVAGAAAAYGVARGLAGARISRDENAPTVARKQHEAILARFRGLDNTGQGDEFLHDATGMTSDLGERSVERNRRRLLAGVASTAISAALLGGYEWYQHAGDAHGTQHVMTERTKPGTIPTPGVSGGEVPGHVDISGGTGHERWIWGHFANEYGANDATREIATAAGKAQAAGYHINAWVGQQGGGTAPLSLEALQHADPNRYGFNSITAPDGTVYRTQHDMYTLLDHFLRQSSDTQGGATPAL